MTHRDELKGIIGEFPIGGKFTSSVLMDRMADYMPRYDRNAINAFVTHALADFERDGIVAKVRERRGRIPATWKRTEAHKVTEHCYICGSVPETDERLITESEGSEYVLCWTCMSELTARLHWMHIRHSVGGLDR